MSSPVLMLDARTNQPVMKSQRELRQLASTGMISPETLISLDGTTWLPARRIKGLFLPTAASLARPQVAQMVRPPAAPPVAQWVPPPTAKPVAPPVAQWVETPVARSQTRPAPVPTHGPVVPSQPEVVPVPTELNPGQALTYAFQDDRWFSKVGIAGIFIYLPVVGSFAVRGWRLEIARQVAAGNQRPLASWSNISGKVLDGVGLRLVWSAYQIPFVMANLFLMIFPFLMLLWWIQDSNPRDATAELKYQVVERLVPVAISLLLELWGPIAQMLFWAGLARYLRSGRWTDFLDLPANGRLVLMNPGLFLLFFLYGVGGRFVFTFVSGVLVGSGVGTAFMPFLTSPPWNWYRGHMWGQLGRIVAERERLA